MKTAISIPDELFKKAEMIAKKLGIPRSQLFANALEEYIQSHNKNSLKSDSDIDSISVQLLRKSLLNDTW